MQKMALFFRNLKKLVLGNTKLLEMELRCTELRLRNLPDSKGTAQLRGS